MGYKFIKTRNPSDEYSSTNIVFDIPTDDVDRGELLESFGKFLRACGFSVRGDVDVVSSAERNRIRGIDLKDRTKDEEEE